MNKLLEKFEDFKKLNNYTFSYVLENGLSVVFKLQQHQFPHLIGLQKLTDLSFVGKYVDKNDYSVTAKTIVRDIKREVITENTLRASSHFSEIEPRYVFLTCENLLSLSFNEVIIDFNKKILNTLLKSDYILIEAKNKGFFHLGLVKTDSGIYVPETFFFETTNYYTNNQKILKIKEITITDPSGKIVLHENL